MRKITIGLLLTLMSMANIYAAKVVAYLQVTAWTPVSVVNNVQFDKITDIVYSFGTLDAWGNVSIANTSVLTKLVTEANANAVSVHLAIGGAGQSANFGSVIQTQAKMNTFATSVNNLINQYGLAGVDIDWEFPAGWQANGMATLCSTVKTKIGNKELSIAVAPIQYNSDGINSTAINAVDFINVMAYDDDRGGNHSSYAFAVDAINYWTISKGAPTNKLRLGVPFYGRSGNNSSTYASLITANPASYSQLNTISGYTLNGQPLIKKKAQDIVLSSGLDGIMIWAVDQDYSADTQYSLLTAIDEVMASGVSCATPNLGFTKSLCGQTSVQLDADVSGGNGFTFQWKNGTSVIPGAKSQTYSATATGTYTVEYIHSGACPPKTSSVDVIDAASIEVINGERCGAGEMDFIVVTPGSYKWYTGTAGGISLHTGQTYTTTISSNTTYYVEKPSVSETVGRAYADGNIGDFAKGWTPVNVADPSNDSYRAINVDFLSDFNIDFITVYSSGTQNLTFNVRNSAGTIVATTTKTVVAGKNRINVDLAVTAGTNYKLEVEGTIWLETTLDAPAIYGETWSGIVTFNHMSLKTGWADATDQYLGLYDWEVSAGGSCGARTPISATIQTNCTPPTISDITPVNDTKVTEFSSVDISATVTDPDNGGINSVVINVYKVGVETSVHTETATNSGSVYSGSWTPTEFAVYTIEIVATDANSNSSTNSVTYTVEDPTSPPTGFESITAKNSIEIYPNPATDLIHVKGSSAFEYIITDMRGVELMNGSTESEINVSNLESGLYILQIQTDGEVKTSTFMKK